MVELVDAKRRRCPHEDFHEGVIFKRCACCGGYIPFRIEDDIIKRGEIGKLDPFYDKIDHNEHS